MTTFAAKTKNDETNAAGSRAAKKSFDQSQAAFPASSAAPLGFPVQRKASCACGGGCPACQAKAANPPVSQPTDALEIEADRMADKVLRMSPTEFSTVKTARPAAPGIQRKCDVCEEEGEIYRKQENGQNSAPGSSHMTAALESGGNSLSTETRAFFEPRFGYDFSRVKVFSDARAARSAQSLNALAYTYGENIVFNQSKYRPETAAGRRLLAHELAHVVQQQTGRVGRMIQKADDASFESGSGVDQGISNGTLTPDNSIMGQTFTVNCGFRRYNFSFKFTKAYKGVYPYQAAGRDVKGIYVKIEASITDRQYCGRCTPMRLLQVIRNIQQNSSGNMETADPGSTTRRERSGWGNTGAASRGWRVDTLGSATNPYFTHNRPPDAEEGNETSPAKLWDAPGDWSTATNSGKEFETCAVCEDASHRKWVAACVQWGYYINSSGGVSFRPSAPVATCGYVQQVRDASERWDTISGNTATGITF